MTPIWLFKSRAGRCWHRPGTGFRTTHRARCGRRLTPTKSMRANQSMIDEERVCKGCFR